MILSIFKNAIEQWEWVLWYCEENDISKVAIRTYGMWCGISPTNTHKNGILTYEVLKQLDPLIIAGYSNESQYDIIKATAKYHYRSIPRDTIRMLKNSHAKCVLFDDGICIVGGINLSCSGWSDFGVAIRDELLFNTLKSEFNKDYKIAEVA